MDYDLDNAVGFLSYAHIDDEADQGRIRRLAKKIQMEYRVLTGETLEIFVDRSDIRWGQKWKERIDGALQSTTFFIPVLSPSFFASDECRREFFEFYNTTRALGVSKYLLAIRYTAVEDLVSTSRNQAKAIAAETQYKDWERLRLVDEAGAEHRQAVNDLAKELRVLMQEVQRQPAQDSAPGVRTSDAASQDSTAPGVPNDDPYGDAPSPLELVAEFPERTEAWTVAMKRFQDAAEEFNAILQAGTAELNGRPASNFAAKLVVLRRVAAELESPTQRIVDAGDEYMRTLLGIDPAFRALAEIGNAQTTVTPEDRTALAQAQDSVRGMVQAGEEATEQVRSAINSGRNLARLSRDMRPALKRYETGSQNIIDGQAVMQEWADLLDEVQFPADDALPTGVSDNPSHTQLP
ncbi:toll/interleukin-1 receptor domain-containing protein [Curtobacterium sp. Leaf261]|uniref:toll/interleukin-1 receptor domain-containing protein n=1 Tax=Curtobacterium sp. Leaf261 TaxID=1736311 RepID=UPI0006FA6B38|nr:toll/interleukin-1 receptor domain-containing protein [Curtobacterium sp. Leaf261]KQO59767.1 hypothetical protein ASF23_15890 [Curtobacterium sp. Leaf261]